MEKMIIGFSSFPDYSGNCKALYEAFVKKNLDKKYNFIWFVKKQEMKEKLNNINIKAIWEKDPNFEKEFYNTNVIFLTHSDYINMKGKNQIFIGLWHGLGPKKIGYALENKEAKDFADRYSNACDYIIATSEFGKIIFSYLFNKDANDVLTYPQPRYEFLKTSNGKENLSKILKIDINKYKKIIMYAPTFRNGLGEKNGKINSENILNLGKYNESELKKFLEENNYLLLLKLHPSEENEIKLDEKIDNIKLLKDNDMQEELITINEVLNAVDLLIADYSSIYIDYINLLRPVLFLDTDINKYKVDRGLLFDSNKIWYPGPITNNINDFIIEIQKLLNDESYYKNERIEFNNLVNGTADMNCDKFIDEFTQIIEKKKNEVKNKKIKNIELQVENEFLKNDIRKLKEQNENKDKENQKLIEKLDSILYSRSYRIMQKIKKIIRR